MLGLALGCDMINVAREALLAIGCIQAQQCHTGHCPTGVTTQNKWLVAGLDPTLKAARLANYLVTLRKELLQLASACGELHPALVPLDRFDIVEGFVTRSAAEVFGYVGVDWGLPHERDRAEIRAMMAASRAAATAAEVDRHAPEQSRRRRAQGGGAAA
jgi:glutamate synthase (ferredoxin)